MSWLGSGDNRLKLAHELLLFLLLAYTLFLPFFYTIQPLHSTAFIYLCFAFIADVTDLLAYSLFRTIVVFLKMGLNYTIVNKS